MSNKQFKMNNLKKLREKKNFTQVRLSIEVGVSQELISQYEIGKSKPTVDNLLKLANFFNCSTDYLLERTNNPASIKNLSNEQLEMYSIDELYNSLHPIQKKQVKKYIDFLKSDKL